MVVDPSKANYCRRIDGSFYSGSKTLQHTGTEEHLQTVQTVHFLEGRTPFCTVCTQWQGNAQAQTHSGASHSHTVSEISPAIKQCTLFLTCLGPVRIRVGASHNTATHSLKHGLTGVAAGNFKTAFVCLLIYCNETVHFLPVCCLAIGYIQYKMVSFPLENLQSVKFVNVSSLPECCL